MALIKPSIDLKTGILRVRIDGSSASLSIPLESSQDLSILQFSTSRVCGEKITALTYSSPEIVDFFSRAVGVPCTLARFPATGPSSRHFKPHLQAPRNGCKYGGKCSIKEPQILLSNESPILVVNRTSVDTLNDEIKRSGGKMAKADVFRANIVLSETTPNKRAYAEDSWKHMQIGKEMFEVNIQIPCTYSCQYRVLVLIIELRSSSAHAGDAIWSVLIRRRRSRTRSRMLRSRKRG